MNSNLIYLEIQHLIFLKTYVFFLPNSWMATMKQLLDMF